MIIRLTFCKFNPASLNEARAHYLQEIIPVVKMQPGNLGIRLIEPVDKNDDFISMTEWATKEDADRYESTGVYKSLVAKLASYFNGPVVAKVYTTEDVMEMH